MKNFLLIVGLATVLSSTVIMAKTAGTVNGIIITVDEANKALNVLTKGQKTWSTLPEEGKKQLIQMMAPSKLVAVEADKSLTKKEKEAALAGFWMQKKMSKIRISDKEAQNAYNKMKKMVKKSKSKAKIPPFNKAKNNIKMQLAQEKVVSVLMKKAKIKLK